MERVYDSAVNEIDERLFALTRFKGLLNDEMEAMEKLSKSI